MSRRPSLVSALALVVATATLTACADPTAPTSPSPADVRYGGYAVAVGKPDSTISRTLAVRHSGYAVATRTDSTGTDSSLTP